jgi:tRNA U54 and U55 pseudouridine synthase Pus10
MGDARGAHQGRPLAAEVADAKVPKAPGPDARTVAEIVGKKAQLKDKPVAVRGRVVKYTANVMGKNWIHLRDGSGSAKDNTHDLLVTTQEEAQIGQIVLARGVVRTDVDLGSGYTYKVLIDGAKLEK